MSIITAHYPVIGALDLLFVVVGAQILRVGPEWTGTSTPPTGWAACSPARSRSACWGAGWPGRCWAPSCLVSVGVGLLYLAHGTVLAAGPAVAAGVGRVVIDTSTHSLLQRSVPSALIGRICGVVEGLSGLGLALGSLVVPALIALGGPGAALIGTALVPPLAALIGGRVLFTLDDAAPVPVVEIALFRAMPHFRALPAGAGRPRAGSGAPPLHRR